MASREQTSGRRVSREAAAKGEAERARLVLEAHLARVLTGIATVLITSGYAHSRLSKLSRTAFVEAASALLRDESRKVSVARIAASTGLTRTEVSRIVRRKDQGSPQSQDPKNRSSNVALGWVSDKDFADARNRPRPLPFRGAKHDFSALVKRYSGDIPARAMLVEMRRLGMVSQDSNKKIRLVRAAVHVPSQTASAMRAVSQWVDLLGEGLRKTPRMNLSSNANQVELFFDSIPQVNAVMRVLRKRKTAFVQGISELGARTARDSHYSLRITVALAVARPVQTSIKLNRRV
jgi:hypothetical protein